MDVAVIGGALSAANGTTFFKVPLGVWELQINRVRTGVKGEGSNDGKRLP